MALTVSVGGAERGVLLGFVTGPGMGAVQAVVAWAWNDVGTVPVEALQVQLVDSEFPLLDHFWDGHPVNR